jgi:nucleoside-diphosphate-sugar epimerase
MNIVVTGCAGFIGSHLTERLLDSGHHVIGIDNFDPFYAKEIKISNLQNCVNNSNFEFHELDIRKADALFALNTKTDLVIHLAAKAGIRPSIEFPDDYIETNIKGTFNLLEWIKKLKIQKLIFASSSSVYGNNTKVPFKEESNTDTPISPYAYTKKTCELMNYTNHNLHTIDIVNLRFFSVYGERLRPDLAIYKFVQNILSGKEIVLFGGGQTSRDYTYISDIITGIENAKDYIMSHSGVFETFNLGNDHPVCLDELVGIISKILNVTPDIKHQELSGCELNVTHADISKARTMLHYNPSISIEEGLRKFIDWYRSREVN